MSVKSKVLINNKFYELVLPLTLASFTETLHKNYKAELPKLYKLQYKDADGDSITIFNQEDYDIALIDLKTPSLYLIITELPNDNTDTFATIPKIESEDEKKCNKEDYKEIENSDKIKEECFVCHGSKVNKKNKQCKVCNGTGEIDASVSALRKDIEESLHEEVIQIIQEKVRMSEAGQSNPSTYIMTALSQQKVITEQISCSICKSEIGLGVNLLYCLFCNGFYICEKCEDKERHVHTLLKGKKAGERTNYEMQLLEDCKLIGKPIPESSLNKSWLIKNVGKISWPKDTKLIRIEGDNLNPSVSIIEDIRPGAVIKASILFFGPKESRRYKETYRLIGNNKLFGPELMVEFDMEEKGIEQNDPNFNNVKKATAYMELIKKDKRFKKEYENNLMVVFELGDWEPKRVLDLIIKYNNTLENVINDLF